MKISAGAPLIGEPEYEAVQAVLKSGWLTQGVAVWTFEQQFAMYLGVKHAVAVNNGTTALHLALLALSIGPGDEVIVPATTFIATVNAVTYTGAKPVIVDVDPVTWTLDPIAVRRAITPKTRLILPVHLYGVPADLVTLGEIADEHGLFVIEDAAEALGARHQGRLVGSIGKLGTFSFYGNKTITTGEGGMITTNDDDVADRLRLLRGQGQTPGRRYWHEVVGFNYRMTEIQAALGRVQMERLPWILGRRWAVLKGYRDRLPGLRFQECFGSTQHGVWGVAVVLDGLANRVMRELETVDGIETRPVFPPMHLMPMYADHRPRPIAEWLHDRGLVLPTHPSLTDDDLDQVAAAIRKYHHE